LAATRSRGAAGLGSEPECEFPTRVRFVRQINGCPHRGNRTEKLAHELVSTTTHVADEFPVIVQGALAALSALQKRLANDWGQMRALITQAHMHPLARRFR
jgi:hypothetical protein